MALHETWEAKGALSVRATSPGDAENRAACDDLELEGRDLLGKIEGGLPEGVIEVLRGSVAFDDSGWDMLETGVFDRTVFVKFDLALNDDFSVAEVGEFLYRATGALGGECEVHAESPWEAAESNNEPTTTP